MGNEKTQSVVCAKQKNACSRKCIHTYKHTYKVWLVLVLLTICFIWMIFGHIRDIYTQHFPAHKQQKRNTYQSCISFLIRVIYLCFISISCNYRPLTWTKRSRLTRLYTSLNIVSRKFTKQYLHFLSASFVGYIPCTISAYGFFQRTIRSFKRGFIH
jgi:hypothetical protein